MSENEPKKETVRITLPQRPVIGESSAASPVKKETVRINLPARPSLGSAPSGEAKKESTRIANLAKPPTLTPKPFAPPAPSAARPAPPATVRSPAPAGGAPRPPQAPGAPRPPQPPSAGGVPVAPRAPVAPAAPRPPTPAGAPPVAARPPAPPVAQTSPAVSEGEGGGPLSVKPTEKKNTARIELPATRQAPQATMKIQQTQPLARAPEAAVRTLSVPSQTANLSSMDVEEDKTMLYVSAGVLLFAVVAFILQLMTFLAA